MMENDEETDSKQEEEKIPKITEENEANNKMEKSEQKCTAKKGRFFFNKGSSSAKEDGATLSSSNGPTKCTHEIIIKDMCGNCGKDLRIKGGYSGDRIEQTNANVSMIHHVPELVVSNEIANELGARDHENILRQRKLILLVDLDQTLIHTSNRPPKPSEVGSSDMFGYQIFGSTFFTKLRPYTRRFLEKINKLYEMHIVTYGQRMYAHKIAELLDPNRIYFEYRILSRDELLSSMHKCGNLKALFPCSEQLILMLDDRPDVWMHSEALIRIKPYRFFSEIGDINAPSEAECSKKPSNEQKTTEGKEANEEGKDDPKGDDSTKEPSKLNVANQQMNELSQPSAPILDDDNSLEHAERILNRVHSLFYQQYEREKKVPDVKRIVGWMRQQVLAGERIVFSGIVPLGVDIRASEIHRLCTQFGAKVDEKIVEGQTTVLVAGRAATEKMLQANRMRIPIVSIQWLGACFERWQKVEKQDFLFNEGEKVKGMPPNGKQQKEEEETNRKRQNKGEKEDEEEEKCEEHEQMATPLKRARLSSESMSLDQKMDHFAQMDTVNKKALHEMEDEVASALSEESEDEDEEGEESSSSAGENQLEDDGREESRHGKPWEDQIAEGGERYGEEGNDEEETGGEYWQEEAEQEENDDEENCPFDYGNDEEEETTRDVELDEDEDELYDEMAADIEQQLNDDGKRNEEKEEEDEDE